MRLNLALGSVFLFVSAVLSEPFRERDQVANLVKQHTSIACEGPDWADAYWNVNDEPFEHATATFHVPSQQDTSNSYAIGVALANGVDSFGFEILIVNGSFNTAAAFSTSEDRFSSPSFGIVAEDVVRASIDMSCACTVLENLTNGQSDVLYFDSSSLPPKGFNTVRWAIKSAYDGTLPFGTVTIQNAVAYGPSKKIYKAEGASTQDFSDDGIVVKVTTHGTSVIIKRIE